MPPQLLFCYAAFLPTGLSWGQEKMVEVGDKVGLLPPSLPQISLIGTVVRRVALQQDALLNLYQMFRVH